MNKSPGEPTSRLSDLDQDRLWELTSKFADSVADKFSSVFRGEPEEQLRNPVENFVSDLGSLLTDSSKATMIGEYNLADLHARPDFGVALDGVFCGYIEVKAPSKSADPTTYRNRHDREQWAKLSTLPNVIYTNGTDWTLWRYGAPAGNFSFIEDVTARKGSTAKISEVEAIFTRFFEWEPTTPSSAKELAVLSGRLCRFLRDDVTELLATERRDHRSSRHPFTELATTWREMLFENATDAEFADQYSQTVVFGLLLARAEGISTENLTVAAEALAEGHLLLGAALKALTDPVARERLAVSIGYTQRVISVVDWTGIQSRAAGRREPWLYFYEDFLAEYDPDLRKRTGSYYTPPAVVAAQVRFADEILRTELDRPSGLRDENVTIIDPAMGTGSYLLQTIEQVAQSAMASGPGMVPGDLDSLRQRLIGFEIQTGPFAVAELQLVGALRRHGADSGSSTRIFVADTLSDPNAADGRLPGTYGAIAASRNEANRIKREDPITVVIGNPPYRSGAGGEGGWVEMGSDEKEAAPPILNDWRSTASGGHRQFTNLYTYFWRWAAWKAFEAHPDESAGIVSFITSAGWLDGGTVWDGMREWLRANTDRIWIIDLEGDKNNPRSTENVFDITVPVAIVIASRSKDMDGDPKVKIARLRGSRKDKLAALEDADALSSLVWKEGVGVAGDPFRPKERDVWVDYPSVDDLHPWASSGISANRTWVVAPTADALRERWLEFTSFSDRPDEMRVMMKESRDAAIDLLKPSLHGHAHEGRLVDEAPDSLPAQRQPVRTVFRSFDRQWIIPDARLLHDPRPDLWSAHGKSQVYLNHHHQSKAHTVGPVAIFSSLIPDMHAFNANSGGRVRPLWRDAAATVPNVPRTLLSSLGGEFGIPVGALDLFAYEAALLSHPGYLRRFFDDLAAPTLRVPLTAEPELWEEVVAVGREVIWLHSYGEVCSEYVGANSPRDSLPQAVRPKLLEPVLSSPGPSEMQFDPDPADPSSGEIRFVTELQDGSTAFARVGPVSRDVWDYEVSGMNVLARWFNYRKRHPGGRRNPPLSDIGAGIWEHDYDRDLLDLLAILTRLRILESVQDDLLGRVLSGPLLGRKYLGEIGALDSSRSDRGPLSEQGTLPD